MTSPVLSSSGPDTVPGGPGAPDPGALPASSRQDWCWHWVRSHTEDSTPLESPEVLRLRGRLDTGALRDALAEIETRHEALRLHLAGDGGPAADAAWPGQRLRAAPGGLDVVPVRPGDEEAEVTRTLDRRLDPTDRMARMTLLRSADDDHVLVGQFHHLVMDATSHDVFRRELAAGYAARTGAAGGTPAEGPAPFGYVDMIRREGSARAGEDRRDRAAAVARTLRAHGADQPLPAGPGAEVTHRARFAGIPLALSAEHGERLLRWCREQRTTPHNALLALLARGVAEVYERDRLVASVYMHGRTTPAARGAVGLLCNVLPVPLDVAGGSLSALARRTGERVLAAWDGVDLPLSAVADHAAARTGTEAVFRTAMSHLEFRMTGGAGRSGREAGAPLPFGAGLSAEHMAYEPPDRGLRFSGRRQALQCARTLYADAHVTENGVTGSLWYDEQYHDTVRLTRVSDIFHAYVGNLPVS
ncbi:condensation domain-containing protein [Streptomyces sp. NPDC015171]|uniref:condensation domain-containing protein n=1 Tax=Streptomyces sp. NPDC015171 TaxID=3364945 RepID=UPI0036F9D1A0